MTGIFSSIWNDYRVSRIKIEKAIPIHHYYYFERIHSISEMAKVFVRPIQCPLFLALNTVGYLIKAIVDLAISIVLAPCALLVSLISPRSLQSRDLCNMFRCYAVTTVIDVAMAAISLLATALALILNPLYVISRTAATIACGIASALTDTCSPSTARLH